MRDFLAAPLRGGCDDFLRAVESTVDPETGCTLGELRMVGRVSDADGLVSVVLRLAPGQLRSADETSDAVAAALGLLDGIGRVEVLCEAMTAEQERSAAAVLRARQPQEPPHFADGRTKVVLVGSGKGGVGKSSLAVNLACSWASKGRRVGLVDADVWGFSVPRMLGTTGAPGGIGDLLLPRALPRSAVRVHRLPGG